MVVERWTHPKHIKVWEVGHFQKALGPSHTQANIVLREHSTRALHTHRVFSPVLFMGLKALTATWPMAHGLQEGA